MWHVSFRSSVATLRTAVHLLLTYLLRVFSDGILRRRIQFLQFAIKVTHCAHAVSAVAEFLVSLSLSMSVSMWSFRWHFTNKSVTGAPYSIKSYSLSHSWTLWSMTETVPSWCRGGTAAAIAQNEQTTEEHSTLEHQSPSVVCRVDSMTSVDVEALRRRG